MELNPYILTGCPVETALEYCEGRLSHSIEDYPDGILIPVDKPLRWTSAAALALIVGGILLQSVKRKKAPDQNGIQIHS